MSIDQGFFYAILLSDQSMLVYTFEKTNVLEGPKMYCKKLYLCLPREMREGKEIMSYYFFYEFLSGSIYGSVSLNASWLSKSTAKSTDANNI